MSKRDTVEAICHTLPEVIDLFICSASFEERSCVFPLSLRPTRVKQALVFSDHVLCGEAGEQSTELIMAHFGGRASFVPLWLRDPLDVADRMMESIGRLCDETSSYVIDVSTFSHEALLILIKVVQLQLRPGSTLTGVYNTAEEYAIGLEPGKKWLTRGVSEVRSVLGYSGGNLPTKTQHLVVLAGFETERAEKVIAAYEPSVLTIGFGSSSASVSQEHHDLNRHTFEAMLAKHKEARQLEFACDDVAETIQAIAKLSKDSSHNVVIAPMNTKISTVGVACAALADESIQLCYAVPDEYNAAAYSSPGPDGYVFNIPIRSLEEEL